METISNIASAATTTVSNLIYGDQTQHNETAGEEPVSGLEGKGTATEPFDQGNTPTPLEKHNETAGKEPVSGLQGKGTATEPFDQGNAPTPLETADKKTFFDSTPRSSEPLDSTSRNSEPLDSAPLDTKSLDSTPLDTKPLDSTPSETSQQKTFLDYSNYGTAGKEPITREPAKGAATDTSSGSNDFLKLNPVSDGPKHDEGAPRIYTDTVDSTYIGMPIVPLNPGVATSGVNTKSSSATESTGITDKAGVTDKVWKESALDDISRSGAPGAGPTAPDSATASTETYQGSAMPTNVPVAQEQYPIAEQRLDGTVSPKNTTSTGFAVDGGNFDGTKSGWSGEATGLVGEKPTHNLEPSMSAEPLSPIASEEKSSKMSDLKDKLKDKLHIGSKDR